MNIWVVKKALVFFRLHCLEPETWLSCSRNNKNHQFINESFVRDIVLLLSIMINLNCSTMRQNQLHAFY